MDEIRFKLMGFQVATLANEDSTSEAANELKTQLSESLLEVISLFDQQAVYPDAHNVSEISNIIYC